MMIKYDIYGAHTDSSDDRHVRKSLEILPLDASNGVDYICVCGGSAGDIWLCGLRYRCKLSSIDS